MVRNELCHKRIADNLQLSIAERNEFFSSIFDLVDLLETIQSKYFSKSQADAVRDQLQDVSMAPLYLLSWSRWRFTDDRRHCYMHIFLQTHLYASVKFHVYLQG